MNWNQPQCTACWNKDHPGQEPVRVSEPYVERERCAWCGQPTTSGIYRRADPRTLPYPAEEGA